MEADALSDVLRTVRLTGAAFFEVAARTPWVAEQPPPEALLGRFLPGAEHLIAYHVVAEGRCFANIIGAKPFAVEAGEIVVFTRGDPHVMSSSPGMRADSGASRALDAITSGQPPFRVSYGTGRRISARLVCGWLACDARPFNPLLECLPPVIKTKERANTGRPWLGELTRLAVAESARRRPGAASVLARLSELMFIEVVREYLEGLPREQGGWLAGLRDPFVGKAISMMHTAPERKWTIERLARQVGVSRSVLAQRFTGMVGVPPMRYLAKWRMQIAAGLLSGGSEGIAAIAADSGYGSEAAFSRAFKKVTGVSPAEWRRRGTRNGGYGARDSRRKARVLTK
jgi:AraC-like DNA-binding protein